VRILLTAFLLLAASPAFAADAANYHALDEMQEKANAYIAALQSQRNAALDQVVALTAELAKRDKECKAK
jgi:hypothetical protein